jgi:hypothetical protein
MLRFDVLSLISSLARFRLNVDFYFLLTNSYVVFKISRKI